MNNSDNLCNPLGPQFAQSQHDVAMGLVGRQYDPNQEYLDRVALEAMKIHMHQTPIYDDDSAEETARYSYLMARAMLKARSQGGAE